MNRGATVILSESRAVIYQVNLEKAKLNPFKSFGFGT